MTHVSSTVFVNVLGYTTKETDRKSNHQKSVHLDHHLIKHNMNTFFYIWRIEGRFNLRVKQGKEALEPITVFEGNHELKAILPSK